MTHETERRRHYRIRFLLADAPRLVVGRREFRIVAISEGGAEIEYACTPPKCLLTPYPVRVIFRTGEEVCTDAVLQRGLLSGFVLRFVENIPLRILVSEQRRLLTKSRCTSRP